MEGRNFVEVAESIIKLLPEDVAEKLQHSAPFWAPEIAWVRLTNFVQSNVKIDSSDETSVKIYATLCNTTEAQMRERMVKDGF